MKNLVLLLFVFLAKAIYSQSSDIKFELPSLISDNMVLQQQASVKLWGKARPNELIKVKTSWKANSEGKADKDGNWLITIMTPKAGGPYTLTIVSAEKTVTIQNVLIGEVWLCSGQSNMEMPLAGWPPVDTIEGSKLEITNANNPDIHFFIVQRALSVKPENNFKGNWQVCSPSSIGPFSATAYFFAKKLYEHLKIPVGLIESAWGGTPAESWISPNSLLESGEFVNTINELGKSQKAYDEYLVWLKSHTTVKPNYEAGNQGFRNLDFNDKQCASADFDDSKWPKINQPGLWEQKSLGEFDGVVWFRKTFEIPENMKGKDLILSLGPIDDMDIAWINGVRIGGIEDLGNYKVDRIYEIPASILKEGKNTIAIRVIDNAGGGGFWGKEEQMYIKTKTDDSPQRISLSGEWNYLPVAEFRDNIFYVLDIQNQEFFSRTRPYPVNAYTASVLNNAMIHPAIYYRIKGAIWYQGEANVGRAQQYLKIFPLMIADWRKDWNIGDFPFYFVQIAPWGYDGGDLNAVSSAELRDAQRLSLNVPHTGMVVTLDIGNNFNIHPCNKLDVGNRLAFWALANNYGVKIKFSGPLYKSMVKEGKTIRIQFDFADGGLVAKNGTLSEFEIAGNDGKFVPAKAIIINNQVVVSSDEVSSPENVRYCWHNGSKASLFNGAGLPASGFTTIK